MKSYFVTSNVMLNCVVGYFEYGFGVAGVRRYSGGEIGQ